MKYIQAILAFVAITSVSARALPADGTLAVRDTDTSLTSRSNEDLSASDLDEVNSIVEGLTGKNPGLEKKAVEVINSAHFPTLASRKKHNGTATDAATATGTADAAAKAAKKAAKASARASKSAAAAAAAETATTAAVKRNLDIVRELESRKKHNGTATTNAAATITDPVALASQSAAKAAKKAAKSSKKAAAAAAAATAAVRRNIEMMAELESRKKHNGTATTNNAATITDPAALASQSAAKAAKKAAKSSKKAAAAAAASATASAATIKRDVEIIADMNRRRTFNLKN